MVEGDSEGPLQMEKKYKLKTSDDVADVCDTRADMREVGEKGVGWLGWRFAFFPVPAILSLFLSFWSECVRV